MDGRRNWMSLLTLVALAAFESASGRVHHGNNNAHVASRKMSIFDLSHSFSMDRMPVAEGGSPMEMNMETHDDGHGAR